MITVLNVDVTTHIHAQSQYFLETHVRLRSYDVEVSSLNANLHWARKQSVVKCFQSMSRFKTGTVLQRIRHVPEAVKWATLQKTGSASSSFLLTTCCIHAAFIVANSIIQTGSQWYKNVVHSVSFLTNVQYCLFKCCILLSSMGLVLANNQLTFSNHL